MRRAITSLGLVALAMTTFGGGAVDASPGTVPPVPIGGDAAAEHRRIVDFWTPARQATAIPRDLVRAAPKARPGGGGGGGGSGLTTGATWTQGGSVAATTGKVFFTAGGLRYTCSASAVKGAAGNLVLSAGHCVHDGDNGAFVTNWAFYPGWNGAENPALGVWTATDLYTTAGWATEQNFFDDDAGFAVVTGGPTRPSLETVLTQAGATAPSIAFGSSAGTSYAFGYPASKKYKGNTLTYCAGGVTAGYDNHDTMALPCDMTGGSSGGPWFQPFANGSPTNAIFSLNSYGYASLSNTMFGPIFDTAESDTYNAVVAAPDCGGATTGNFRCVDYTD